MINSYMRHTQSWTLLRYTNTACILIHFCLANYSAKRTIYNLGFMKYKEKTRECRELIGSFMENLKAQFRLSPTGLQLELLPALYTIIQPFCTLVRKLRIGWVSHLKFSLQLNFNSVTQKRWSSLTELLKWWVFMVFRIRLHLIIWLLIYVLIRGFFCKF